MKTVITTEGININIKKTSEGYAGFLSSGLGVDIQVTPEYKSIEMCEDHIRANDCLNLDYASVEFY